MHSTEQTELLIRLEATMSQMCQNQKILTTDLDAIKQELSKRQCLLHTNQIQKLEHAFDPKQCSKNTEKIATLEKLTWAALITGVGLVVKSFWSAVTP